MATVQFAQKAFIEREGRLLLVRKSPDDPECPELWEVPGGRIDFGEDVDDHLRREVAEEVGLIVTPGSPFAVWSWTMSGRGAHVGERVQVIAVARACIPVSQTLSGEGRTTDDFLAEMEWVECDRVLNRAVIPSLVPVIETYLRMRRHLAGPDR